jgi:hypothetical protein
LFSAYLSSALAETRSNPESEALIDLTTLSLRAQRINLDNVKSTSYRLLRCARNDLECLISYSYECLKHSALLLTGPLLAASNTRAVGQALIGIPFHCPTGESLPRRTCRSNGLFSRQGTLPQRAAWTIHTHTPHQGGGKLLAMNFVPYKQKAPAKLTGAKRCGVEKRPTTV